MIIYIEKHRAINALWETPNFSDPLNVLTEAREKINSLTPADVVEVETLKAKISELKYQMDCRTPAIDYYTGYMTALSTVEGILDGIGGKKEE